VAGGMGVVYKAEDTRLKRVVALKFLPPGFEQNPAAVERFQARSRGGIGPESSQHLYHS